MPSPLALTSDRGTVTAELAIALPAVLLMLTFAIQALSIQVGRIQLVGNVATLARAAARGEEVAGAKVSGKFVCVTKSKQLLIEIRETQCARRLGL